MLKNNFARNSRPEDECTILIVRRVRLYARTTQVRLGIEACEAEGLSVRLLVFDHVCSNTTLKLPVGGLAMLARSHGAVSVCDGAHGPMQEFECEPLGSWCSMSRTSTIQFRCKFLYNFSRASLFSAKCTSSCQLFKDKIIHLFSRKHNL